MWSYVQISTTCRDSCHIIIMSRSTLEFFNQKETLLYQSFHPWVVAAGATSVVLAG